MRVMIFMFTATYAESEICTPSWAMSEPSGPMLNGMTYIVRPAMQPSKRPVEDRLHLGRIHPVVGRAGVLLGLGADEGAILDPGDVARVGAGEEAVRAAARSLRRMNVPASTSSSHSRSYSSSEPSHQCDGGRSAQFDHLRHPRFRPSCCTYSGTLHPPILSDSGTAPSMRLSGRPASGRRRAELRCAARRPTRFAVLTSGGDSAGMNAAVRAVVRTGLAAVLEVFAVYEGLQGLVDGGERIRPLSSADVSGILHLGGTVLGTARSQAFRTRDGRGGRPATSSSGTSTRSSSSAGTAASAAPTCCAPEWPEPARRARRRRAPSTRRRPTPMRQLALVGLVGSIDNDMFGTDMTIGADTALHRIVEAVDAIQSTASSHQRSFVIEVMGRHCGYLALMGGLATGANFVLIPERPPDEGWEEAMCVGAAARAGDRPARQHRAGRRGRPRPPRPTGHRRARQGRAAGTPRRGRTGHDPRPRPARRLAERLRPLPGHACSAMPRSASCSTRPTRSRSWSASGVTA